MTSSASSMLSSAISLPSLTGSAWDLDLTTSIWVLRVLPWPSIVATRYSGGIVGNYSSNTCIVSNCYVIGILTNPVNTDMLTYSSNTASNDYFKPKDNSNNSKAEIKSTTANSDIWDDIIAGTVLTDISKIWDKIFLNQPWKLKSFLAGVTTIYSDGNLRYTSKRPINSYSNGNIIQLVNSGKIYQSIPVTLIEKEVTFNNVSLINNNLDTYLVLYDNSTFISYLDVFKINVTNPVTPVTKVESITLISKITIKIKKQAKIQAIIRPSTADNKSVTWTSSNTKIAVVSDTGVITARAVGKTIIKATARDGSNKTDTSTIIVTK
jgi:hypothetical protein